MSQYTSAIFEFNQAFGIAATPKALERQLELIDEEYEEWIEQRYMAPEDRDDEAELKEICDVLYTIYGYAFQKKWDIDSAFLKVHKSNMSKLVDGLAQYDHTGKVVKGPGYNKPNLKNCLETV